MKYKIGQKVKVIEKDNSNKGKTGIIKEIYTWVTGFGEQFYILDSIEPTPGLGGRFLDEQVELIER